MIIISYRRESVCMGDDVHNGEYKIKMSDLAALGDLIDVLRFGGNGNTWKIPSTVDTWYIDSNIGILAELSTDENNDKHVKYIAYNADTPLSSLGVEWVFAKR